MELVGGSAEGQAGALGHLLGGGCVKPRRGVEPRAHGGAPQGQLIEPVQGGSDHVPAVLQHGAPAADLLAEGDGHRVLEMGAAGFHHVPVGVLQVLKADQHLLQGGEEPPVEGGSRCDVQGSGEGVVGALGQVHVVVGVEQVLPRLEVAPPGDDFVAVHVGLGAAAGLPDSQGEVPRQLPGQDGLAGPLDQGEAPVVQLAQPVVGGGAGFLQNGEGLDEVRGHFLLPDGKVFQAPLGLGAPELVRWDGHLAHGVVFHAIFHGGFLASR